MGTIVDTSKYREMACMECRSVFTSLLNKLTSPNRFHRVSCAKLSAPSRNWHFSSSSSHQSKTLLIPTTKLSLIDSFSSLNQKRGVWSNAPHDKTDGVHPTQLHNLRESTFILPDVKYFLENEIKSRDAGLDLSFPGFEVEAEDTMITLTKQFTNELITVKWNITEWGHGLSPEIYKAKTLLVGAYFIVHIRKQDTEESLILHCRLAHEYPKEFNDPERIEYCDSKPDILQFVEVSIPRNLMSIKGSPSIKHAMKVLKKKKHFSELIFSESQNFTLEGNIMDETMWQLMLQLLNRRGIGDKFIQDFHDFNKKYEEHMYVNLLKGLQHFLFNQ